eukprot:5686715-Heterocapsa_arctica.AAC.1
MEILDLPNYHSAFYDESASPSPAGTEEDGAPWLRSCRRRSGNHLGDVSLVGVPIGRSSEDTLRPGQRCSCGRHLTPTSRSSSGMNITATTCSRGQCDFERKPTSRRCDDVTRKAS